MRLVKSKLNRASIINMYNIFKTTIFENPIHTKFRYAISKNLKIITPEIEDIKEVLAESENIKGYKAARNSIFSKYKVNTDNDLLELSTEVREALDKDLLDLNDKSKEILEEINRTKKENEEFLSEEIEISIYKVDINLAPNIAAKQENQVTGWQIWQIVELMIDEPEEVQ
jgi:hypothetical protein